MILTINNAKFIEALKLREGDNANGHWAIQEFLFHIDTNFSNATPLVVTAKNEKIADLATLSLDDMVTLKVFPASRQNKNGYWDTQLNFYAIADASASQESRPAPKAAPAPAPKAESKENDLPWE